MGQPPISVELMVIDVLKKDCWSTTCPYFRKDSEKAKAKAEDELVRLTDKVKGKIKGRVSDGFEVRKLEERTKLLEQTLKDVIEWAATTNLYKKELEVLRGIVAKAKEK